MDFIRDTKIVGRILYAEDNKQEWHVVQSVEHIIDQLLDSKEGKKLLTEKIVDKHKKDINTPPEKQLSLRLTK